MLNYPRYPCTRIFYDTDEHIHFITYTNRNKTGHYSAEHIGNDLVEFVELDLTEYKNAIAEVTDGKPADNNIFEKHSYDKLRNIVFDIAQLLENKHRYVYFYLVGLLNEIVLTPIAEEDIQSGSFEIVRRGHLLECFDVLTGIVELQELFKEALHFCLDKEYFNVRSIPERMVGFYFKYPDFNNFVIKSGFANMPVKKGKLDYQAVEYMNSNNITDVKEQLKAINQGKKGVSLLSYYLIESLEEMLFFEFSEMLSHGMTVKKCKLCGRYFLLTSNRKTDFCDRIYKGKRTCKQVGGKKAYSKRVNDNDNLKEYNRIYNRMYSRMYRAEGKSVGELSGNDITLEEFNNWSEKAKKLRKEYIQGGEKDKNFIMKLNRIELPKRR